MVSEAFQAVRVKKRRDEMRACVYVWVCVYTWVCVRKQERGRAREYLFASVLKCL